MRPFEAPAANHRRDCRPGCERLEARDLPSTMPGAVPAASADLTPYLADVRNLLARRESAAPAATAQAPGKTSSGGQPASNQSLIAMFASQLYGPVTGPDGTVYTDVPQPTPAEIKRQSFISGFVGSYTVGPPRTTDRASTIHIFSNGNTAGSNQFRHGRAQLLILPPADPSAIPDPATNPIAGMVVGLSSYVTSNFLSNSGNLLFDLTNMPGVASNDTSALSHGLPSRLSWTLDQAGAGVYTSPTYTFDTQLGTSAPGVAPGGTGGAVAWQAGTGEVDLTYIPDRHPNPGTLGSGKVIVKFVGLFNNPGDLNAINKTMNN